MATTPTNLPVPSESPRDLKFNAGKIDEFVTSSESSFTDRFGNKHYTIEGINKLSKEAMASFGYITMDSFEDGNTLTLPNQVLRLEAIGEYYRWDGAFPKVVPAASTPESTGGIGAGKWLGVGDAALRSELSSEKGASLIGYGDVTVADKLNELKTPFDFGAKGDGITDDTLALQAYIDGVDGDIDLYGKTYLVSKNPALATTYPTEPDFSNNGYNFCPCLALVGKKGIKI
ncbi:TPA: hypothetical protein ACXN0H_004322, partial [Enterobacter hormaechei]